MVQRMGHQHLELCMIVIEELKKTLFGAEILYRMFKKAQKQIRDRRPDTSTTPPFIPPPGSTNIDLMADASRDDLRGAGGDLDLLSTIWNPDALMASYGSTFDSE